MNRVGFHGTHETQPSRMVFLDSRDCSQFTNLTSHYLFGFKDAIETGPGEGMLVSLSSASTTRCTTTRPNQLPSRQATTRRMLSGRRLLSCLTTLVQSRQPTTE